MASLPGSCPVCGGPLELIEAHCRDCNTSLRGAFERSPFERLSAGQTEFLRLFVASRGNQRAVGQKLGVSYPSVRAKLEEIVALLRDPGQASTP